MSDQQQTDDVKLEPEGWEPPSTLTAEQVLQLAANPDKTGAEVLGWERVAAEPSEGIGIQASGSFQDGVVKITAALEGVEIELTSTVEAMEGGSADLLISAFPMTADAVMAAIVERQEDDRG